MQIYGFKAWRPFHEVASAVASVPYDTVTRAEAKALAEGNPNSFLHVVRPEIGLPDAVDDHDDSVYAEARSAMERFLADGIFIVDPDRALYVYRLQMGEHVQRGVVACCDVADYEANRILRHEKTRRDKEDDRTRHIKTLRANTGPVFLTYRDQPAIGALVASIEQEEPLYHISASDGVEHTLWKVPDTQALQEAFASVARFYIADGHHRAAAAARAAHEVEPGADGVEHTRFLSVLFPAEQLQVMGYHRVVADLQGMTPSDFLARIQQVCTVNKEEAAFVPQAEGAAGMYMDGQWYALRWDVPRDQDPVSRLDVSVLQERVLGPMLDIQDPRTSDRISFVGGIRGAAALEKAVDSGQAAVAFAMSPVSMESVMAIADAGREMPPKSTWFEPKLRSGLLVHPFDPDNGPQC